jgi:fibronectin-binding autotransporter adhesin
MLHQVGSQFAPKQVGDVRVFRPATFLARRSAVARAVIALGAFIAAAESGPATAAIAIVDNPIAPISSGGNPTTFNIGSFTVSPAANVLIVEVGTRGVNNSADTITFGGQTLTLATQFPSVNTVFRDSAIYYLYNPTPGTATLGGTFSPTGISDYVLSAFTLGGVNTAIAPITAGADGQANASTTATLTAAQAANVVDGSFAVMEQTLNGGTTPFTYSATASGTASGAGAQLWTGASGANILAAGGDIADLLAGTDSYTGAATTNTNTKNPLVVAIFTPGGGTNWIGGTSTNWDVGSNWQGGIAPNGVTAGAIFGNSGANPTVNLLSTGETVGSMVFNGSVNTAVTGANTLTLGNSSAPATIAVNAGTHAINTPVAINNLTISTVAGSQLTFGGAISQGSTNNSLSATGAGTIVLSAANSFGGPTTISGGQLRLGNAISLQNSTVTVGTDNGLAFAQQIGAFNLGGLAGSANLSLADTAAAPITLAVGSNGASTSYSGSLSGGGALAKTGAGTLTLAGNSSYTGGTLISAGAVVAGTAGSLGTGPVSLSNGGTLRVNANPRSLLTGFGGTSTDVTGTGTNWTVNNTAIASNPINNNVLTLTDNAGGEARSAFFNTPQPIAGANGGFVASFTYQASGNAAADGIVFMLHNDSRGLNAIGGTGGGLGYTDENGGVPVQPSVGIALNIYNGHMIGTNLLTNGNANNDVYLPSAPVNPGSGNPIAVTISYNPSTTTGTETLTDTVLNTTFPIQFTNQDLAAILGGNTAYVGFSGGTGGLVATQTISNFTYGADSTYSNNVTINGGATATIDVVPTAATSTVAMGALTVSSGAGATLNVTASAAPADTAFGLSLGATTLSANATFNVANNGAGTGTLRLGPVGDTGSGFGVAKSGAGTLLLASPNTYRGNTTVTGGTLRLADTTNTSSNNIPSSPTITVGGGASLDVTGLMNGTLALASGQTLKGAGTVVGAVTASAASAVASASGTTLTVSSGLALQDQSHSAFMLGTPNGSGNAATALVNVTGGTFSVTGTNIVDLSGTAVSGGTYELFAFTSGSPSPSQFSLGANSAGNLMYTFSVVPNSEVDLTVGPFVGSANWDFDGNGSYSDSTKWNPARLPTGAGFTATFGNGVSTSVGSAPTLTVLVDAADVAGSLVFSNTHGAGYILGNDLVPGHGITLNNSGAGATVSVAFGVTVPQQIQCNLTLADNALFNIAPNVSLLITVGSIGGTGNLSLTGGGSLTIDTPSAYVGNTTVTNGTLSTTATGTISSGNLTVTAADTIHSTVNLGNDQTVSALSGSVGGGGATARVSVAAGTTLSVNQSSSTVFQGVLDLAVSSSAHGGGTLTKSSAGVLEIQAVPALRDNSNLNVNGGLLRFNVSSGGPAVVGSGVLATVTNVAVLELAGSVATLSDGTGPHSVGVLNNSSAAAGLHVIGTNQRVGGVDGTGTTQVDAGASITANHIVQSALVIGGTDASHLGLVTIDASDAGGNPLTSSGGLSLTGSLAPRGPFGSSAADGSSLTGHSSSPDRAGVDISGTSTSSGASSTVPEPATWMLVALGLAALGCRAIGKRGPPER